MFAKLPVKTASWTEQVTFGAWGCRMLPNLDILLNVVKILALIQSSFEFECVTLGVCPCLTGCVQCTHFLCLL